MGAVLYYLLTNLVPKMFENFREEMENQGNRYTRTVDKVVESYERVGDRLSEEIRLLSKKQEAFGDLIVLTRAHPEISKEQLELAWEEKKQETGKLEGPRRE